MLHLTQSSNAANHVARDSQRCRGSEATSTTKSSPDSEAARLSLSGGAPCYASSLSGGCPKDFTTSRRDWSRFAGSSIWRAMSDASLALSMRLKSFPTSS